jgi:hypothetical protein
MYVYFSLSFLILQCASAWLVGQSTVYNEEGAKNASIICTLHYAKRQVYIFTPKSPTHGKALWCKNHENPSDRKSHTCAPLTCPISATLQATPSRRITVTSSLNKISTNQLGNRAVVRGETLL